MSATCASEVSSLISGALRGDDLGRDEIAFLLSIEGPGERRALYQAADCVRKARVGDEVFLRGIVEFSGHCRRNCHYCGLRAQNRGAARYRIPEDAIVSRAHDLKNMACTTIVLQSGEDPYYDTDRVCRLVERIKAETALAVTLSIGERSYDEYRAFRQAGADRYLLRHETASRELYRALHPGRGLDERIRCLQWLKELGYETGSGCIVGLPGQSVRDLAGDVLLLRELDIDMIGIGPFIPHPGTPLGGYEAGSPDLVLKMTAVLRLVTGDTNIPATTALGVLDPTARALAFQAGANVFMPNFTPDPYTARYEIYPGKPRGVETFSGIYGDHASFFEGIGRVIGRGYGNRSRTPREDLTRACAEGRGL